ncbi:hypothetical protein BpHYR1_018670 [Brachionus plicatilis]|uniref:Uncharacterized protein n=1 Tax=Brachionus plicatilis TaxID=10195 RepID=A0A3M7T590_BRAPC|nr:hypothetical protein BpHYR1_018670 [Brachionus plicatilis]
MPGFSIFASFAINYFVKISAFFTVFCGNKYEPKYNLGAIRVKIYRLKKIETVAKMNAQMVLKVQEKSLFRLADNVPLNFSSQYLAGTAIHRSESSLH